MKFPAIHATVLLAVVLLMACHALPPPQVVADAPQHARVADLLRAPPLRPVPAAMAELRPPYRGCEHLYSSLHFAARAGVVYVAGRERYAVMDIGTGEVIATGAGEPGGQISENGRVLAIPVESGMELRDIASGDTLVLFADATPDEFDWIGDAGVLHVAPPARGFADSRVVHLDLVTGLESSLLFVPDRPSRDAIYGFGAGMVPGEPGRYLLLVRDHTYEMTVAPGPGGRVATLGAQRPDLDPGARPHAALRVGDLAITAGDEGLGFLALRAPGAPGPSRVALPGFVPHFLSRTADPDRVLMRGVFVDAYGAHVKVDGHAAWRHFYYSLSRRRLAPVAIDLGEVHPWFVDSTNTFVVAGEDALRPYTPPPEGAEGDISEVLATAREEVLAAALAAPSFDPIAADTGGKALAAVVEWHRTLAEDDLGAFPFVDYTADNGRTEGTLEEEFAELRRDVPARVAITETTAQRDTDGPLDEHSRITGRRTFTLTTCSGSTGGDDTPARTAVVTVLEWGGWTVAGAPFVATSARVEPCRG